MRQLVITVAPSRFDVSLTLLCPPALILSRSLQHPYISSLSFYLRPLLLALSRALRSSLLHPLLLTPLSLSLRFFTPIHTTSHSATSSPSHQNGSRQSGRSSNTPACGSRRVCPSAASTLAGDSSSRSFECLRPFSFSLSLIHSLSFSLILSLSLPSPVSLVLSFLLLLSLHFPLLRFLASVHPERRSPPPSRYSIPSGYGALPIRQPDRRSIPLPRGVRRWWCSS